MSQKKVPNKGGHPPKHAGRQLARFIANQQLDARTGVARLLKEARQGLIEDAGGAANLTNRELFLVDRTAALLVIVGSIENYVFKKKSLVGEDGELIPVLRKGYLSYQNTLRLNLESLGLKPQKPDSEPDLHSYLKQKQAQEATE